MSEPRPRASAGGAGLLASLRRLVATTIEIGQVRLELFATELEQQKLSILSALLWAALGSVCLGVGLVLLSGLVVLLFWDSYRLQAIAALVVVYFAGGMLMLRHAMNCIQAPSGAFAASRAELMKDRAALTPREAASEVPRDMRRDSSSASPPESPPATGPQNSRTDVGPR